jgi:hypothetical protein
VQILFEWNTDALDERDQQLAEVFYMARCAAAYFTEVRSLGISVEHTGLDDEPDPDNGDVADIEEA